MTDRAPAELPAESRISSRAEGDEFTISIPGRGTIGSMSGSVVVAAFLGLTFLAQGIISHQVGWSIAGALFFVIAAAMLSRNIARSFLHRQGTTLRMDSAELVLETGPGRRSWKLAGIAQIGADAGGLFLRLADKRPVIKLAGGLEPAEAIWIAEQLQHHLDKRVIKT
jgi:hypothetical protein